MRRSVWQHRDVSTSPEPDGYREIAPPDDLVGLVRCVWVRRTAAVPRPGTAATAVRVLPDNCADWIFDLSALPGLAAGSGGAAAGAVRALAVGPMTRPILVPPRSGALLLGVRFAPGRWRRLCGGEAAALRDRRCDLRDAAGDAAEVASRLLSRLLEAPDDATRVGAAIEELRRVARLDSRDPLVAAAIEALAARSGRVRIEELARRLGCSRQHLAARFRREVGLAPKTFASVLRFRAALAAGRATRRGRRADWATVALRLGYVDPSHLLRDFRRFAGVPPSLL